MRILFISSWFPYPPDNGSKIRILNLLQNLAEKHELILLCFSNHSSDWRHIGKLESICRRVHVVKGRPYRPSSLRALRGFFHPWPRRLTDIYSTQMKTLVDQVCAQEDIDLVIASQVACSPYLKEIRGIPRVLEELEVSLNLESFLTADGPVQKSRQGLHLWKFKRYLEHVLMEDAEGFTVVSAAEHVKVQRIAPKARRPAIIPNGVDLQHYEGDFGVVEPDTLIFTGVLSYSANLDALIYFLQKIWPLILRVRPDARLSITGRTEGVPLDRLPKSDGVTFTGYLDDIRPWIARSRASVVPLRIGGGTRLKILESMALGTPVVSTSKGAEGLDVEHGRNILIADDPISFADSLLLLLRDDKLRSRLSRNGRALVRDRYDWRSIVSHLEAFLRDVVAQAAA